MSAPEATENPVRDDGPIPGRCGAQLRSSRHESRWCPNYPVTGRTRCRMHGGATPRGLDMARVSRSLSGYRGSDLPTKLGARFLASLSDPELMSLRQDIAFAGVRLGQLVEKFPAKESAEAWSVVGEITGGLHEATRRLKTHVDARFPGDEDLLAATQTFAGLVVRLNEAIASSSAERAIWSELFTAQEHVRRLQDTERKREVELGALVTARQGQTLVAALLATIIEEVRDPVVKRRILERLRVLLGVAAPATALGVGRPAVVVADGAEVAS